MEYIERAKISLATLGAQRFSERSTFYFLLIQLVVLFVKTYKQHFLKRHVPRKLIIYNVDGYIASEIFWEAIYTRADIRKCDACKMFLFGDRHAFFITAFE